MVPPKSCASGENLNCDSRIFYHAAGSARKRRNPPHQTRRKELKNGAFHRTKQEEKSLKTAHSGCPTCFEILIAI
jgi:hypothetical protein